MTFTGLDLRRRPDGGFAVLECNPSPMFAGIQRRTGAEPNVLAFSLGSGVGGSGSGGVG
jgi:glutathione synthase/RimK-type ligase-like ATP-grasp enzyme